jgi:hypothetical protein
VKYAAQGPGSDPGPEEISEKIGEIQTGSIDLGNSFISVTLCTTFM